MIYSNSYRFVYLFYYLSYLIYLSYYLLHLIYLLYYLLSYHLIINKIIKSLNDRIISIIYQSFIYFKIVNSNHINKLIKNNEDKSHIISHSYR